MREDPHDECIWCGASWDACQAEVGCCVDCRANRRDRVIRIDQWLSLLLITVACFTLVWVFVGIAVLFHEEHRHVDDMQPGPITAPWSPDTTDAG